MKDNERATTAHEPERVPLKSLGQSRSHGTPFARRIAKGAQKKVVTAAFQSSI